MDRRKFLQLFGLAATAQLIPGNRVWSFPSKIVVPSYPGRLCAPTPVEYIAYGGGRGGGKTAKLRALYGIPAALPDGLLANCGPYMGISREPYPVMATDRRSIILAE